MIEVELQPPAGANSDWVVQLVEQVCRADGLDCSRKGTLAGYPGCVHWHYKKAAQKGTLEITWWETENRLWFKVARGRTGVWIEEALEKLKKEIEFFLNTKDPTGRPVP